MEKEKEKEKEGNLGVINIAKGIVFDGGIAELLANLIVL